ncbi:MAG: putative Ig domain-containing protein, partial [Synergistaceae bacterium]|nr:putative Ig domain-containing protein [Synergistaceae bacterium]
GKPYRGTIEAQNGRLPYEWDYDENLLPDGLRMKEMLNDTTKLELSGVPEKNGEYKFTVTVTDVYGMSASQEVSIVIGDGSDPTPINPDPVSPDPTPINPDPVSPDPTPINPDPVSPDPTPINPDPVSPDPTPTPVSSSGGGGGCNSGFGVLILAALVLKRSR